MQVFAGPVHKLRLIEKQVEIATLHFSKKGLDSVKKV